MRIGVIIVTFNGEKWIYDCLESLSRSTFGHQTIVVDNSSDDNTLSIIRENFKEVRIIELDGNKGFGRANNEGLKIALEELWDFTFLLNQDTKVFPKTLEELIEVAKLNTDYGIISPIHLDGSGEKLDHSFKYYLNKNANNNFISDSILKKEYQKIYDFDMINAAAWLLPAKTLNIVGGFHPMFFLYGEDDNYCQRVRYHQLKIGVIPNSFIIHDSENNNLVEPEKGSKKYYERFLKDINVEFGDPNTNNFQRLPQLKKYYYKIALRALLKLRVKDFKINWTKATLISNLNFADDIMEMRSRKSNYLEY